MFRWLRSKLSIRPIENAWENAQNTSNAPSSSDILMTGQSRSSSNLPFIIFFSALIGAPYLTWKMLSSPQQDSNNGEMPDSQTSWTKGKINVVFKSHESGLTVVKFDFDDLKYLSSLFRYRGTLRCRGFA